MVLKRFLTKEGWDIYTQLLPGYQEHIITVDIGDDVMNTQGMAQKIRELGFEVLQQFVLAGCEHYDATLKAMGTVNWPLTWVHGDACKGGELHSSQILAVSGIETRPVILDGKVVGRLYEDGHARYCRLSGIIPGDLTLSRVEQARHVFEQIQEALVTAGMTFTDVVRTWLYLDDLLAWYDDFNVVRTRFFNDHGVFDRMVPASTGIGAANPFGAAMMADAYAVVPKNGLCTIQTVASPLQCPAISYKSSFSRAVEMKYPTHRQLLVSGTASINPDGSSAYKDDPARQIDLTMRVVQAILESRGMEWADVTRGIAYFKDMAYLPIYRQYCSENNITVFPLAVSHADICRDDLLFEIEVDAFLAIEG
jgi:enamine deaminase RidA (YjgF/YER057c/UK114 family)